MAEVRKMEIIPIEESFIVQKLQENEAERITFAQFKEWSAGPDAQVEEEVEDKKDPFGNSSRVPDRFKDATAFHGKVKVQHPCYTTTAHDIGIKNPSQVDMPVKWRGKEVCGRIPFIPPVMVHLQDCCQRTYFLLKRPPCHMPIVGSLDTDAATYKRAHCNLQILTLEHTDSRFFMILSTGVLFDAMARSAVLQPCISSYFCLNRALFYDLTRSYFRILPNRCHARVLKRYDCVHVFIPQCAFFHFWNFSKRTSGAKASYAFLRNAQQATHVHADVCIFQSFLRHIHRYLG